jgi:LCP family protein required for cell wall assembly
MQPNVLRKLKKEAGIFTVKQQFVRIQPGNPGNAPQQESPSEAQIRQASTLPRAGLTPPAVPDAVEQSPVSYWARKEEPQGRVSNAPPYPQAGAQQLPPNGTRQGVETQQPPYGPAGTPVFQRPPQGRRTGQLLPDVASAGSQAHTPSINQPFIQQSPLMQSQNGYPMVLPSPEATRPPYAQPMQPGMPPAQWAGPGPMRQNNAPMQSPYGPPMQPGGMPYGQRPVTGPISQNNMPPLQPPFTMSKKALRKKRRFPIWARVIVAVLAVLLVGGGTAFGYYQANFANPLGKITGQKAAQIGADGKSTSQIADTGNGIGSKRVNILLLGSDNDGKNTSPLAQTDIVITIDPQTQYVGMLSIPRDLRVVIPNEGTGKMDAAFSFGWQGNFGGATPLANAAGLSIATVEKNFGIHIDHYAWVGLDGFVKVINTANGVDIDATHPIVDNAYPNDVNTTDHFGYKRLYIAPGPQHMDGIQALEYVRTRHADLVGDFGRSARQQQVLSQLKTKLDTPSIITKLPELASDLGDTVKTDMSIQDIINFMGFARNIDTTKLDRVILSPPYSSPAPDTTGDFLPNCSLITPKIAQMFAIGNNANCISTASMAPGNTVVAANQTGTHTSISALSTTPLSSSVSAATQILNQLQPIQRNAENVTQVHSLLDLLFLVTFDSLDGAKV